MDLQFRLEQMERDWVSLAQDDYDCSRAKNIILRAEEI
jgi:hypothetical protein